MRVAYTDERLINYAGPENILVVPITSFVKQSGEVSLVDAEARAIEEAYPAMTQVMGTLLNEGVPFPMYRNDNLNVLGVPDRTHYAAKVDENLVVEGLAAISRSAEEYKDFLIYTFPLGGDEKLTREMLEHHLNVVLLCRSEDSSHE